MDFNKNMEQLLQNDQINFKADPSIRLRLLNHLKMNSVFSYVSKNSIAPVLAIGKRFGVRGWKYGIAAAFFVLIFFGTKMGHESSLFVSNDTITNTQFVDSIGLDSIGFIHQ